MYVTSNFKIIPPRVLHIVTFLFLIIWLTYRFTGYVFLTLLTFATRLIFTLHILRYP